MGEGSWWGGFPTVYGNLPSPPGELAIVSYAIAAAGLAIGAYTVISGHLLVRAGRLKQIWSQRAARLLGLSLMLWSLFAVWLGWDLSMLSHETVPTREWLGMPPLLAIIASLGLQWYAYHIDRCHTPPAS